MTGYNPDVSRVPSQPTPCAMGGTRRNAFTHRRRGTLLLRFRIDSPHDVRHGSHTLPVWILSLELGRQQISGFFDTYAVAVELDRSRLQTGKKHALPGDQGTVAQRAVIRRDQSWFHRLEYVRNRKPPAYARIGVG